MKLFAHPPSLDPQRPLCWVVVKELKLRYHILGKKQILGFPYEARLRQRVDEHACWFDFYRFDQECSPGTQGRRMLVSLRE